jgi:hypothetical protein
MVSAIAGTVMIAIVAADAINHGLRIRHLTSNGKAK